MSGSTSKTIEYSLSAIVGEQLSSVVFVQDYVQLHFDGPTLTAITLPTIEVSKITLGWGTPGYRDALCERIGKTVRRASMIENKELRIEFDDNSVILISIKPEDHRGDEAVIFNNTKDWWAL
jgi:hypothetical protein